METRLGTLTGWALENHYRHHVAGYFGRWLRRARAIELSDLPGIEEAYDSGQLAIHEWESLSALDLLVRGRAGKGEEAKEVLVAVEISANLNPDDVERAYDRAALLRRLGFNALPVVAGENIRPIAEDRAKQLGVAIFLDGRVYWGNGLATL